MKKEIIYSLSSKFLKSKNLKSQLLMLAGILVIFCVLTVGTLGFIAYKVAGNIWTAENKAMVEGLASASIDKSKNIIDNQKIGTPQCLQEMQNRISINSLLNLGSAIEAIKQSCFSANSELPTQKNNSREAELI